MGTAAVAYEAKKRRLVQELRAGQGEDIALRKDTSNLFRDRLGPAQRSLDVRDFNQVLRVDPAGGYVEVEGMTSYERLVQECLRHGVMPTVVPQLKSITVGGATTGLGIESSSFRFGLVHETVLEMEVLLGDGTVVTCSPDNEHRDLFFGFPNSYGTLGYALKLKVKVVPVQPFVSLRHLRFRDAESYFRGLAKWCESDADFVDGVVFGEGEYYLTIGSFTQDAPYTSDYTYRNIYYRSIREREADYLTTSDYLWRWDTDWFWCSKNLLAQNPLVRTLLGRSRLNSITYTKVMRWNARWQATAKLNRLLGIQAESVIQDVQIPVERGPEFLEFYFDTIRFTPVWICPTRAHKPNVQFDLYPMDGSRLYVNFGFWDVIRGRKKLPPGYFNRLVEEEVIRLGGMKSLYSDSYFTSEEFDRLYNRSAYERLKTRYDKQGLLKDFYAKCVLKG